MVRVVHLALSDHLRLQDWMDFEHDLMHKNHYMFKGNLRKSPYFFEQ